MTSTEESTCSAESGRIVPGELFASECQQDQGIGDGLPEECLNTRPSSDQRRARRYRPPLYKYLGTVIDDRRDWTENSVMLRKENQRLYFIKKLESFHVNPKPLRVFCQVTVESVICYNSLCLLNSLGKVNAAKLERVIGSSAGL